jgi:cell division septation protein DedD
MSDEGLREIHLDGKQLVFLFMTATVVAVVIFLCGVLVGQGVRAEQTRLASATTDVAADPTEAGGPEVPIVPAPAEGTRSPSETFTYPGLLNEQDVPLERLSAPAVPPAAAPPAAASAPAASTARTEAREPTTPAAPPQARTATRNGSASSRPAATRTPAVRATAARAATPAAVQPEPVGSGYVVQVAAVRERSEADAMARRLTAKGYPAFVTSPSTGPARVFRVRVGKYNDRREAESVASRLEKEEQFKPWITR